MTARATHGITTVNQLEFGGKEDADSAFGILQALRKDAEAEEEKHYEYRQAVALEPHEAQSARELTLEGMEVLEVMQGGDDKEMWEGRLANGQVGWFPKSCVNLLYEEAQVLELREFGYSDFAHLPTVDDWENILSLATEKCFEPVRSAYGSFRCGHVCAAAPKRALEDALHMHAACY